MRRLFLRLHRYAGLAIAFFLVVVGLTGSVLAFYEELERWLNPQLFTVGGQ
ncbi:MAG: PepSY domain-containing protein [Gammaproteobacteria bacterium]